MRIVKEIRERLTFLDDVGVGYLNLDRASRDAVRRRGAAAPARDPDRLTARRRALHPRRAVDRPASARQQQAHRHARAAAEPRQHRDRGRARRADDAQLGLARRHGAGGGRARWARRRRGDSSQGAAGQAVGDRSVPLGHARDRGARAPRRRPRLVHRARRCRAQPEGHRRRLPDRQVHRGHRGLRLWQVDPGQRDRLQVARQRSLEDEGTTRRARGCRRDRRVRQGDRDRPAPDRSNPALEPCDVHGSVHAHPRAVLVDARLEGARVQARPVLVQRQGRPLRDVQGRRSDQDRDALPARRVRAVRDVQGQAVQPRDARGAVQGQDDRRRARDVGRGSPRLLLTHPEDSPAARRPSTTSGSTT